MSDDRVAKPASKDSAEIGGEKQTRSSNLVDVVTGASVASLGAFAIVSASGLDTLGRNTIGPGLLPQAMGVFLVLLGFGLIVGGLRSKTRGINPLAGEGMGRVFMMIGALLVFVVTLQPLGFLLSGTLFLAITFFGVQRNFKLGAIISTIVLPIVFWVIFVKALGLPLSPGLFSF
jgi:hypothetical protein